MTDKPLVSIVIPVYNQQENFLRQSIESALGQTYSNTEIIISDNYSTNGSSEIITAYAHADKRILVIRPPIFLSLIENFIFAYSFAKGKYICPLSSDDILYPEMINEHLQPFFSYPDLSFSYSVPLFFSDDIITAKWVANKLDTGFFPANTFLTSYIRYRLCTWGGILFKTADYNKMGGFSKDYVFAGDIHAIIQMILLNGGVYCINKPLSAIRQWKREEHSNRTPYALDEVAKIYRNAEKQAAATGIALQHRVVEKAKKAIFVKEIYPIAYFVQFNKRSPEIIEKTAVIIAENYPKGLFNFIVSNRKNKVGLLFSVAYLSWMKLKNLF